jgi:hypothetical protein
MVLNARVGKGLAYWIYLLLDELPHTITKQIVVLVEDVAGHIQRQRSLGSELVNGIVF